MHMAETPEKVGVFLRQFSRLALTGSRGPAKGYTGALEHRLEEMEQAFLQVLSVIDDNTIDSAFNNRQGRRTPSGVLGSSADSSKAGSARLLSQWEQYPLKTAGDIKRWADVKWKEPAQVPEELCIDAMDLELENRDTSELRESVYDSSSRYDPAVPSPLDSLSTEEGSLELPREFREQFIW